MSLIKVTGTSNIKSVIGINSNVKYTKIVGINTGSVYWKAGIEAWQSAEVYVTSGGNVGIRVFDLDGNPMSGVSYSFTVKYTLYENNKSKKSDTKTAEPNYPSGNITISTGVEVAKGKSYYAKVEVIDAKEKYMDWDGTTESKVLFDGVLIGDSVDGASAKVVGASATLSFTSSASNVVQVIIQRRKSGGTSSDWVDWRNYYIFPADGNQSKATMLINNNTSWSVTTAAWYSKSGYNYSVEWGLGDYEYYVKYIYDDSSVAEDYDVYDISPKTVEYNEMSQFVFNGNGNYMPSYNGNVIDIGTYTVTITRLKDNVVFLYNGEYTRLKSSYTTYLYIVGKSVDIPSSASYTYTGGKITFDYDSKYVKMSGTYYATNAGSYTAYADLVDPVNTRWSDGTSGRKYISWRINQLRIPFDIVSRSFTYDGSTKRIIGSSMSKYIDEYVWVDGNAYAINAGYYTCTFGLDEVAGGTNVVWDDTGNSNDRKVIWFISSLNLGSAVYGLYIKKSGDFYIDLAKEFYGQKLNVKVERWSWDSGSRPSSATATKSGTYTCNANGNLVGTFSGLSKKKIRLVITVTNGGNNNFSESAVLDTGNLTVSDISSSYECVA